MGRVSGAKPTNARHQRLTDVNVADDKAQTLVRIAPEIPGLHRRHPRRLREGEPAVTINTARGFLLLARDRLVENRDDPVSPSMIDAIDTMLAAFDAAVDAYARFLDEMLPTSADAGVRFEDIKANVLANLDRRLTPPTAAPRPEADRERPPSGCTE
jgi:hypothetical protein